LGLLLELAFYPIGTGSPSVSSEVAEVVRALEEAGFEPEVLPMGTLLELGSFEEALEAIRVAREAALRVVDRAVFVIRIDERRDVELSAEGKVESVLRELGRR